MDCCCRQPTAPHTRRAGTVNATTFLPSRHPVWRLFWTLHILAFSSLLTLAVIGRSPENAAGWLPPPPTTYTHQRAPRPSRRIQSGWVTSDWTALEQYVALTSPRLLCQIALLLALTRPTGDVLPLNLPLLPWSLELAAVHWPGL